MIAAPLRLLAGMLALEALLLVGLGVGYAVVSALGSPEDLLAAELAAAFALALGLATAVLGRAVGRRRGWARTPAVLLNLLTLPVAVGLLQAHVWLVGIPVLLLALATLATFAHPVVRRELREPV